MTQNETTGKNGEGKENFVHSIKAHTDSIYADHSVDIGTQTHIMNINMKTLHSKSEGYSTLQTLEQH